MGVAPREPEEIVIDEPTGADVDVMAELFKEDMDALGVDTRLEMQREVARAVVEEATSRPPQCLCWVARVRGEESQIGGLILANFNWSLKFAGRALWIETLYVTPTQRRKGIGARLVETMLDWAEEQEIRGVDLEAYRGNTPASILYRSLGFRRLGRERFYFRIEGSGYL